MSNVSSTELFFSKYPITVKLIDGTQSTVNSDAELQSIFASYNESNNTSRAEF
jgi:hypothetical protein